ncbi:hypothetical protein AB0M48_05495 [Lentzea sp. NPDC051208]|uniref:hypothetical protein n=1 Tax=Lentzea sp. NPDC051208 TaxID=3154642 RepID=UPI003427E9AB
MSTRDAFINELIAIAHGKSGDPQFKRALVEFGSETPDNLNSIEQLELDPARSALVLRRHGIPISDLLHAAEDSDVPPSVREAFPLVTQAEWDAAMRLVTLILIALEPKR